MLLIIGITLGAIGAFAGAQSTVVGPHQRYWLIAAWLVVVPISAVFIVLGLS